MEAAGGRNRGDVSCIEPGVLLQGHVRLGDRAVVPSLHGGADGCMVKRVLQTDAKSYKLEDLRTLPVSLDLQGVRRKEFHWQSLRWWKQCLKLVGSNLRALPRP